MVTPGTGKEGHTPESPHCTKSGQCQMTERCRKYLIFHTSEQNRINRISCQRKKKNTLNRFGLGVYAACILEHIPLKLSWMKTVTEKSKLDLQLRTFCVKFDSSRLITVMDSSSYNNGYLFSNNLEGTWLLKKLCLMFTCPVHPKSCLTNWSAMIHWVSW